ncbi:MAG: hypothetical protein HUJ68_04215 [Clostridia bacterium]|nr:hypothetical protein [Clostridia bacterium]
MINILSSIFIFGVFMFCLHYLKCYKSDNPGLTYADKSIKTQLFILSKNLLSILLLIVIYFSLYNPQYLICNKIILPSILALALYISIRILPNNYISPFQFAQESGIKGYKKFSSNYGRFYEILFISLSLTIIGVLVLGMQIHYAVTNSYEESLIETVKLSEGIESLITYESFIKTISTSIALGCLNSCVLNSETVVFMTLVLLAIMILVLIALYYIEWFDIKKANKKKTGILRTNLYILAKRQLSLLCVIFLGVIIVITYIFYHKIYDILDNSNIGIGLKLSSVSLNSDLWLKTIKIILCAISILFIYETIGTIIKLAMCYRHKRKMIYAIEKQELINQGKCDKSYEIYKGIDFTSKLLDYQFNVFRFMFYPKDLQNKPATSKNIKEMIKYIDDLGACEVCILLGIPLISTNNLILAYKCYKEQLKLKD